MNFSFVEIRSPIFPGHQYVLTGGLNALVRGAAPTPHLTGVRGVSVRHGGMEQIAECGSPSLSLGYTGTQEEQETGAN